MKYCDIHGHFSVIHAGPKLCKKCYAPKNCSWLTGAVYLGTIQGTKKIPLLTETKVMEEESECICIFPFTWGDLQS